MHDTYIVSEILDSMGKSVGISLQVAISIPLL